MFIKGGITKIEKLQNDICFRKETVFFVLTIFIRMRSFRWKDFIIFYNTKCTTQNSLEENISGFRNVHMLVARKHLYPVNEKHILRLRKINITIYYNFHLSKKKGGQAFFITCSRCSAYILLALYCVNQCTTKRWFIVLIYRLLLIYRRFVWPLYLMLLSFFHKGSLEFELRIKTTLNGEQTWATW